MLAGLQVVPSPLICNSSVKAVLPFIIYPAGCVIMDGTATANTDQLVKDPVTATVPLVALDATFVREKLPKAIGEGAVTVILGSVIV
jgi:hypothetical protein